MSNKKFYYLSFKDPSDSKLLEELINFAITIFSEICTVDLVVKEAHQFLNKHISKKKGLKPWLD
ncbi:MAG: hypothetical protein ACFFAO_00340 [Candidatus Hermodarchaeota archaeon]